MYGVLFDGVTPVFGVRNVPALTPEVRYNPPDNRQSDGHHEQRTENGLTNMKESSLKLCREWRTEYDLSVTALRN